MKIDNNVVVDVDDSAVYIYIRLNVIILNS